MFRKGAKISIVYCYILVSFKKKAPFWIHRYHKIVWKNVTSHHRLCWWKPEKNPQSPTPLCKGKPCLSEMRIYFHISHSGCFFLLQSLENQFSHKPIFLLSARFAHRKKNAHTQKTFSIVVDTYHCWNISLIRWNNNALFDSITCTKMYERNAKKKLHTNAPRQIWARAGETEGLKLLARTTEKKWANFSRF